MPIEIKELHIKVTVNADQQGQNGSSNTRQSGQNGQNGASGSPPDMDHVVSESVEQVLDVLRKKKER